MKNKEAVQYVETVTKTKKFKQRIYFILPLLSLSVVLCVFWWLKLNAITMAGDAFCGMEEHKHKEECFSLELSCSENHVHSSECFSKLNTCKSTEHTHVATCYSDLNAGLENALYWESTFEHVPQDASSWEKIILISKSQLGYKESTINFVLNGDLTRSGYTRYGEWYGNPYGDWANMFTSFCLNYAGIKAPMNSGADAMLLSWEEDKRFRIPSKYSPIPGDIVFFDKDQNGKSETTGIITEVTISDITVIEGDIDNEVKETSYSLSEETILGYGLITPKSALTILSEKVSEDKVGAPTVFAKTTAYNASSLKNTNSFVLYVQSGTSYYAFDGNGNAVSISIDSSGNISADITDINTLLWTFTQSGGTNSYLIQNAATGRYMHAYTSNGSGATTSGAYTSVVSASGNGVKIKSNSEYAYLDAGSLTFKVTQNQNLAATYYFGLSSRCTVWLDGTNGHLMSLDGSLDKNYSFISGSKIKLPEEWQSPAKYSYVLKGWYDVTHAKYYAPGEEVVIEDNTVFYADWAASTYDIGQYNSHVANTVSTNDFITTNVFDYGVLFNVLSENPSISVSASSHTETWNLVTGGIVAYENRNTINYIFRDWDQGSVDISYPKNTNDRNTNGSVHSGLYTDELGKLLFATNDSFDPLTKTGIIGKQHLGTADHLFQIMNDPNNPNYGYYYYDSSLNAASYNQSDKRFYVYEYLERTSDSAQSSGSTSKSDFLPLNSPYVNTNGKDVRVYTYNGENGEYSGVYHYMYDAKYNSNDSSTSNVGTNFLFGMSVDIDFYLPDTPGSKDANGDYGNQDLYGKDMHFKFSGDDDVWIFVDGKLVLDIGGIHGAESGDINFSTGVVTVNGTQTGNVNNLAEGEHTLTLYYLERGSSQSNCAIYFNLAPRFSFSIQKEDVLTQEVLNGAEFSVFTDKACTIPAKLWHSEESYENGDSATNVFIVENGVANMWGLSAGSTYYIKETSPPFAEEYGVSNGIICIQLNKKGVASYSVEVIQDGNSAITNGFTVHGFRIDEETQKAYIVATNAPTWVEEITTVQILKKWEDNIDHSLDSITAYLTITDRDGTVRRIREIELSEENDWTYTWTNLPKFYEDGITEIQYGAEEAYKSGYYSQIEKIDKIVVSEETWAEAYNFANGQSYILKTNSGYLSSTGETSSSFCFVNEATAKNSPLSLWTATVSGTNVKLTNGVGQIITCQYNGNSTYFYLTKNSANYQTLKVTSSTSGVSIAYSRFSSTYYFSGINSNGTGSHSRNSSGALFFQPTTKISEEITQDAENPTFQLTNIPLEVETSFKVNKAWDVGMSSHDIYQQAKVTVKLLANGKDTGRTITLSLKNNWSDVFLGLPYKDENGNVIVYSVLESWETEDWLPSYGETITHSGEVNTYETTITNHYRWGRGYELPATGSYKREILFYAGYSIMIISFASAVFLRIYKKIKNKKTKKRKETKP